MLLGLGFHYIETYFELVRKTKRNFTNFSNFQKVINILNCEK